MIAYYLSKNDNINPNITNIMFKDDKLIIREYIDQDRINLQ